MKRHSNNEAGSIKCSTSRVLFKIGFIFVILAPVVQTLDSAIHRKNHYPVGKY